MRNYRHFSSVSFERRVTLREHGVETIQFELQRAPDLHPEEGAGVVHDVHGSAVQHVPVNTQNNVPFVTRHWVAIETQDSEDRGTFPGSFNAFV